MPMPRGVKSHVYLQMLFSRWVTYVIYYSINAKSCNACCVPLLDHDEGCVCVLCAYVYLFTSYSSRNSFSILRSRASSRESSKAVSSGSLEESAIKDGLDSALYALMRACECRSESVSLETTQSSQPHLI
jgi:uncharacterized Zn finger protein (UPF0148 family)